MPNMKRRVIYLSDGDWAKAQAEAGQYQSTISAYFRSLIVGGSVTPIALRDERRAIAERTGGPFSARPFTPVPKPGRR